MPDGDSPEARLAPGARIVCSLCRASVRPADYDIHLRRAHRLFTFQGVRRTFDDTIEALLEALLVPRPDPTAWPVLEEAAREVHGGRAEDFLAATLGPPLARLPEERRATLVQALGALLGKARAAGLAAVLARSAAIGASRHLALVVVAHLPAPLDPVVVAPLRELLLDRELPLDAQLQALAAVVRSTGPDSPLIADLLPRLTSGLGKGVALRRLQQLEGLTGPFPMLNALCAELEEQVRMTCPRCGVQMRREGMIEHLWEAHRQVLDGTKVRDPWAIVEEWLAPTQGKPDRELIDRCRLVAERIDPVAGPRRLARMFALRGLADADDRRRLLAEAAERHCSRCPSCYALVHLPAEELPLPIARRAGRLTAEGGYAVVVDEGGLRTALTVRLPGRTVYRGREPDRLWTPRGAAFLIGGTFVLLALACALAWPWPPLPVVALLLGLAVVSRWAVAVAWKVQASVRQRAHTYAWELLAPRLHEEEFSPADAPFLAGLVRLTLRGGTLPDPGAHLENWLRETELNVVAGKCAPGHLAWLVRLQAERAREAGEDPLPLIVKPVARCFEGKLPPAFAQCLLESWEGDWWTAGQRARLRVLLCDRAFEAGFEVRNLIDAGQTAPAVGAALGTDRPAEVAALRLLWSLRPTRSWERCSEGVLTAFELAAMPWRAELFGRHPGLLLWHESSNLELAADSAGDRPGPAQILLTTAGVWLQEVLFPDPPRVFEVRLHSSGSEMVVGAHTFRAAVDLDPLARRLERWFRYAFHEFLPQVSKVETWRPPDRAAVLRAWGKLPCPECKRPLLPRAGEMGIAVAEEK
jgi:hypothetical protein